MALYCAAPRATDSPSRLDAQSPGRSVFRRRRRFAGPCAIYGVRTDQICGAGAEQIMDERNFADPFAIPTAQVCLPRHINPRIAAQAGLFTAQPNPVVPLVLNSLFKITIPEAFRGVLQR